MLTRVISAIVAIAIFVGVVYFLPPFCFTLAICVVMGIAAYEMTYRNGIVKNIPLTVIACLFAALMPLFVGVDPLSEYLFPLVFLCVVAVFFAWLLQYGKVSLVMALTSLFAGVLIPLMFSLIVRIRGAEYGEFWILFPLAAAWMTDTGAYFTGFLFGRHKLCEKISPKKTVEGAIGGVIVCIISLFVFAEVMKNTTGASMNYVLLAVGALVLSVIAQVGDLSFSIIKREYNIKDYGNLMPGHGGALDRFDSTIFTIPLTYILFTIGGIL